MTQDEHATRTTNQLKPLVLVLALTQLASFAVIVFLLTDKKAPEPTQQGQRAGGVQGSDRSESTQVVIKRLKEPPQGVDEADRDLEWYALGEHVFALVATFTMPGGGPELNNAEFKVLGQPYTLLRAEKTRLPFAREVLVERVGPGRALLSFREQEVEMVARGGAPAVDWQALARANPEGATSTGRSDVAKGAYSLRPPKDPRTNAPAEDAPDELEAVVYSVPEVEWEQASKDLIAAFQNDLLLKDALDSNQRPYGALVSSVSNQSSTLEGVDLREGDMILEFQDQAIYSAQDFRGYLSTAEKSHELVLLIERGEERFFLSFATGE